MKNPTFRKRSLKPPLSNLYTGTQFNDAILWLLTGSKTEPLEVLMNRHERTCSLFRC